MVSTISSTLHVFVQRWNQIVRERSPISLIRLQVRLTVNILNTHWFQASGYASADRTNDDILAKSKLGWPTPKMLTHVDIPQAGVSYLTRRFNHLKNRNE